MSIVPGLRKQSLIWRSVESVFQSASESLTCRCLYKSRFWFSNEYGKEPIVVTLPFLSCSQFQSHWVGRMPYINIQGRLCPQPARVNVHSLRSESADILSCISSAILDSLSWLDSLLTIKLIIWAPADWPLCFFFFLFT